MENRLVGTQPRQCPENRCIKNIEAKVDVITDKIKEIHPDRVIIKGRLTTNSETVK